MRFAFAFGVGLLTACSTAEQQPSRMDWTTLNVAERQQLLIDITTKCHLPTNRLKLVGDEGVEMKPDPNDRYERIECLISQLHAIEGMKLGFVGNEAFIENSQ